MDLIINGEARRVEHAATVAALLAELGLDGRAVVVEQNRRIVRRPDHDRTPVRDGDVFELVHFVGGG